MSTGGQTLIFSGALHTNNIKCEYKNTCTT